MISCDVATKSQKAIDLISNISASCPLIVNQTLASGMGFLSMLRYYVERKLWI